MSDFIAREAGVEMTLHQFRHLAAKLFLDQHPDGYETVRRLLGHKSLETTMRYYRELEAVLAASATLRSSTTCLRIYNPAVQRRRHNHAKGGLVQVHANRALAAGRHRGLDRGHAARRPVR